MTTNKVALVMYALAASAAMDGARAAPCLFEPQPVPPMPMLDGIPTPPQAVNLNEYHRASVRGAGHDKPFSLSFRASNPVWLYWQKWLPSTPTSPLLRQRLIVERQPDGASGYQDYCATEWTPIDRLPSFGRLKLGDDSPTAWRVRIFEENLSPGLTVLDEDLSEVTIHGKSAHDLLVDPAPLPYLDFLRPPASPAMAQCTSSFATAPGDAILVEQADIAAGALDVPGYLHVLSGRNLFLEIAGNEAGPPITVGLAAKTVGLATPAVPVCTATISRDQARNGVQWIVASHPYQYVGSELRWTITLASDKPSAALGLRIYRDRLPSQRTAADQRGADIHSCIRKNTLPDTARRAGTSPLFRSAYALSVRTGLRELGVAPHVRQNIVDAMLAAVGNWRASCARCSPYQFSVIDIDGDVYVPATMLQGRPENFRATFSNHYPFSNRIFSSKNNGFFTNATPMVKVSGTLRQRLRFCNQEPDEEHGFSARNSPLCRPTLVANADKMIIYFDWSTRDAPCGPKPRAVACWNGTDRIVMNLKEFSFYAENIGNILLGSAPQQVDLVRVFTHEVGHWLGLGHLTGDGSIMSEHFADARCIDDLALSKINNIAVGVEKQSRTPETLLYEK